VFSRKIDPASPEYLKQGKTDSDPIMLEGVSPEEFENFLWVFYNPCVIDYLLLTKFTHSAYSKHSIYDTSVENWRDILNLADKWKFPEVKELAVRELQKKMDLDVVSKVALYQHYDVDPRHLIPLYAQLCERPDSLTREEAKVLGLDATVLISATRQTLRARPSDGGLSALPAGTEEDDVFRALELSLDLEDGCTRKFRGNSNVKTSPT